MPVTPTRIALVAALLLALTFVWYRAGRGRWRAILGERFLYGVPWGTAIVVAVVVAFYLLAQDGLRNWSDPLILPYITWSLFYPTGLVTAGIAHASPAHLISNMTATLALAPLAEYAWSHYPPNRQRNGGDRATDAAEVNTPATDGGAETTHPAPSGPLSPLKASLVRPWVRALVIFPGALLGAALVTAVFSMGPGLGFSGVVYAILGFALVNYPFSTVVAIVVSSALSVLSDALSNPVVYAAIEVETPAPPGWAGIGFQAHLLGFLLGVLAGVALLYSRDRKPAAERVFFGTVLVGMVQALWLVSLPVGSGEYALYLGVGVTFVLLLTIVLTTAVSGRPEPLPRPLSVLPWAPSRRAFAVAWLVLLTLGFALGIAEAILADASLAWIAALGVVAVVLALPGVPPVVHVRPFEEPVTWRGTALAAVAVVTALVALPAFAFGLTVVEDSAVPGSGEVIVGDYAVTYEENVSADRTSVLGAGTDVTLLDDDADEDESATGGSSGVVVVNENRDIWSLSVREEVLEFERNATVRVGTIESIETVHAERTGWDVAGNESAYAVDLEVGDEVTRSFTSEPVQAHARVDGHAFAVVPTADGFDLRVLEDGSTVAETAIPDVGETATVEDITVVTEVVDGTERVVVESGDTAVEVAEREAYPQAEGS